MGVTLPRVTSPHGCGDWETLKDAGDGRVQEIQYKEGGRLKAQVNLLTGIRGGWRKSSALARAGAHQSTSRMQQIEARSSASRLQQPRRAG